MTPAEKRKQKEERAKLKSYRNRLMALKDIVPNINELWQDNQKIVRFFEGGEVAKYEGKAIIKPTKQIDKVGNNKEILTKLTPEIYKERKAQGINDRAIMAEFGLYVNKFTAWKKANDLMGQKLEGGRRAHKEFVPKTKEGVTDVVATKEETITEQSKANEERLTEQLELAQKAEKQALEELLQYQAEFRKLEVDYRNQSTELARVKEMLEKLKHTAQINVWLMKQHIGFVEQADLMAGRVNQ